MQRKYLYVYKKLLEEAINKAKTTETGIRLNAEFVYTCLKNKRIAEQFIDVCDKQFNPESINGYSEYLEKQKQLYNKFLEDNKEVIQKNDKNELQSLENDLKIILEKNRKDNYLELFSKLDQLNKQKLEFLEKEYEDSNKFKRFNLSQFPNELDDFFQSFMQIFIDLIDEA